MLRMTMKKLSSKTYSKILSERTNREKRSYVALEESMVRLSENRFTLNHRGFAVDSTVVDPQWKDVSEDWELVR